MDRCIRNTLEPTLARRFLHRGPVSVLFSCVIALFASTVDADVIRLTDGRRFEGKILSQDDRKVRIDTMIGRVRATLNFDASEIASIEDTKLPTGFYEPTKPAPRISDPRKFRENQTLYLEVPVIGAFGKQVFADGLARTLSYARRHKIQHVVFFVESSGGNLDEAREMYDLLKNYKKSLTYHAIVRNCLGDALAVPFWCDTLHLLPGARIGGTGRKLSDISDKYDDEEEEIVRAQMAYEVVSDTGKTGRVAEIIRAMILPSETLAAWRGKDGTIFTSVTLPDDVSKTHAIFKVDEGEPLAITYEQALELGMPAFEGGAGDLGKLLGLRGWTAESDYGRKAMAKMAAEKQRRAKAKQASYEARVKKNIGRRESTERYIEHNMKQAAAWDPTKASYKTYSRHWNWGWGWSGESQSSELTKESRRKWRNRTDASMYYMNRAAKGLNTMKRLDRKAAKLGLELTFKTGEIDMMLKDIRIRFGYLNVHRNKKNE